MSTEEFLEAESIWNLKKLESDLETEKGDKLTPTEKKYLRGILCNFTPKEISEKCQVKEESVKVTLSRQISPLLKILLGQQKINLSRVPHLLAEKGYKLESKLSNFPSESQTQKLTIEPDNDYNFIGRETDITHLENLVKQGKKIIGIYGKGGVGKTTLAKRFIKKLGLQVWEILLPIQPENITPVEAKVKKWLNSDETDFMLMLEDMKSQLKSEQRFILIDNLETALDGQGKFIASHQRYLELLRFLSNPDVNAITLITSREPLKESKATVEPLAISGLDEESWKKFFNHHNIAVDSSFISEMHKAYGGNTKAMEILCGAIKINPYNGDLETYWKENRGDLLIERDLEDLVVSQFDRLAEANIEAYYLLCRLGMCSDPKSNFYLRLLLSDLELEKRRHIIKYLQNCFLLDCEKDYHNTIRYYIHPVIKTESLNRLRKNKNSIDKLCLCIKQEIDKIIELEKDNFNKFWSWLSQKISDVKCNLQPKIVRAFYFSLELSINDMIGNLNPNPLIPLFEEYIFEPDLAFALGLDYTIDNYKCSELYLDRELACAFGDSPHRIFIDEFHVETDLLNLLEILENKQLSYADSMDFMSGMYNEYYVDVWAVEVIELAEKLRQKLIEYRNIGHNWHFTTKEKELLKQYYDSNNFLVDCLHLASEEVRAHIEDTLLLPMSEIEKRPFKSQE